MFVRVEDGILCNSLYRMTFMLGWCPILSPGVARRQEDSYCQCILGNDETMAEFLRSVTCYLLSTPFQHGSATQMSFYERMPVVVKEHNNSE